MSCDTNVTYKHIRQSTVINNVIYEYVYLILEIVDHTLVVNVGELQT